MKENGGLSGNQLPSYSDCHHPFTSLQVLSDGDVRPCCWGFGAVGNLNLNSLEEIWNNEMINQLRNDIKENKQFNKMCVYEEAGFIAPCIYVQSNVTEEDKKRVAESAKEYTKRVVEHEIFLQNE
jgi:hypothetical protein